MNRTGECICGAVKLTATTDDTIHACHCNMCQTWAGGSPLLVAPSKDLKITGEASIANYQASHWGERGFCAKCGTTLYWRMQGQTPKNIAVGVFDDASDMAVTEEIFVDHRAAWMMPWPGAAQLTEADVIARSKAARQGDDT